MLRSSFVVFRAVISSLLTLVNIDMLLLWSVLASAKWEDKALLVTLFFGDGACLFEIPIGPTFAF